MVYSTVDMQGWTRKDTCPYTAGVNRKRKRQLYRNADKCHSLFDQHDYGQVSHKKYSSATALYWKVQYRKYPRSTCPLRARVLYCIILYTCTFCLSCLNFGLKYCGIILRCTRSHSPWEKVEHAPCDEVAWYRDKFKITQYDFHNVLWKDMFFMFTYCTVG